MIHAPLTLRKYSVVPAFSGRSARAPPRSLIEPGRGWKHPDEEKEDAMAIHVSGRMALLFERHELEVDGDPPFTVPAFRCRWCGFTVVADTPDDLPDHGCTGPRAEASYRGVPEPPLSHSAP